ncbi:MAG: hypothetical protein Q7S39_08035 [Ignavibacteria bacterium]|nr:hypothetical protein [Ignavibacteria bacterium]
MPDDVNIIKNQDSEQNPIPVSPQEPTLDAPIPPMDLESANAPSDAPESSPNDFSVKSNDIPLPNSTPAEAENEPKTEEKQAQNEPSPEPVFKPVQAIEPPTAQVSTNEPLKSKPEELSPSASLTEEKPPASPEPKPRASAEATPPVASSSNHMRELQVKEQLAIKNKKRKKLDLVMTLFIKQSKNGSTSSPQVTNDEVEKFLHVSDATATRYLSILEKEGKIKQNGKTGKGVSYSKII